MLQSLLLSLICIFAVFGIICFIYTIMKRTYSETPVVLGVYNRENSIECEIRQLLLEQPYSEIIVVDMGSSDNTKIIVDKLCKKYPGIKLICTDNESEISKIIWEYKEKYKKEAKSHNF